MSLANRTAPTIEEYAQGGINYVWSYWSNQQGYKTPSEWEAYGQVGKDFSVQFDAGKFQAVH